MLMDLTSEPSLTVDEIIRRQREQDARSVTAQVSPAQMREILGQLSNQGSLVGNTLRHPAWDGGNDYVIKWEVV
jgi:hypothetical protein